MTALSTALVIAAIAGTAAIFIAQPLQRFYELRGVCRQQMLNSANVRVPDTGPDAALRAHHSLCGNSERAC